MSGWISIGEPDPQALTPTEERVKEMLDKGYHYKIIAMALRMSHEFVKDTIYEIRKKEGIMRRATITDEEKQTMKRMFAEGKTIAEIAEATGRGTSSVDRIVKNRKPAQINPEFDAAVNEMIEDAKAENAEEKSANAEEKFTNAEPEKIPHVIWCALDDQCSAINMEIETREQRLAELQEEIAKLQTMKREIREWMEART